VVTYRKDTFRFLRPIHIGTIERGIAEVTDSGAGCASAILGGEKLGGLRGRKSTKERSRSIDPGIKGGKGECSNVGGVSVGNPTVLKEKLGFLREVWGGDDQVWIAGWGGYKRRKTQKRSNLD